MDFEIKDITNQYRGPDRFWLPILENYLENIDESIVVNNIQIKGKISPHSTIEEVMILFDYHNKVKAEKKNRLKYGPGLSRKMENWIKEIQDKVMGVKVEEKDGKKILIHDQAHTVRASAFNDMMDGKTEMPISEYANLLMVSGKNTHEFTVEPYFFVDIAVGAGYGTIYHGLYDELENIKKCEAEDLVIDFDKVDLPDISESAILKLGLLYKIGVTRLIADLTRDNFSAAGKLIEKFTDVNCETAKKILQSIYRSHDNNKSGHPFFKSENLDTVNEILNKLKINNLE
jgi:hypothetical protein